jgi:predicted nucleotidyltransferase
MSVELPLAIDAEHLLIVRAILKRLVPEREVWAFGSRAKRTAKPFSDLDLAILGDEAIGISRLADLREAFQESMLPFKVDIVDWASADERFREIVAQCPVVIQGKRAEA